MASVNMNNNTAAIVVATAMTSYTNEPQTIQEALSGPERELWNELLQMNMSGLKRMKSGRHYLQGKNLLRAKYVDIPEKKKLKEELMRIFDTKYLGLAIHILEMRSRQE